MLQLLFDLSVLGAITFTAVALPRYQWVSWVMSVVWGLKRANWRDASDKHDSNTGNGDTGDTPMLIKLALLFQRLATWYELRKQAQVVARQYIASPRNQLSAAILVDKMVRNELLGPLHDKMQRDREHDHDEIPMPTVGR